MIVCPHCSQENIEGADVCEQCEQPLNDLYLPDPQTLVERSLMKDRVSLLDPRKPVLVSPDMPVGEVLKLMVQGTTGCAIVTEEEKVVGVFTERDALLRINTEAAQYADRPITDFMTKQPQSLDMNVKIAFAVHKMDLGGFRHVPIVDSEGRATGVISVRDILRYLTKRMSDADSA